MKSLMVLLVPVRRLWQMLPHKVLSSYNGMRADDSAESLFQDNISSVSSVA